MHKLKKISKHKRDEGYFDVDKNIQKLLSVKLLGFLPFYIQGNSMQGLQNRKKYL